MVTENWHKNKDMRDTIGTSKAALELHLVKAGVVIGHVSVWSISSSHPVHELSAVEVVRAFVSASKGIQKPSLPSPSLPPFGRYNTTHTCIYTCVCTCRHGSSQLRSFICYGFEIIYWPLLFKTSITVMTHDVGPVGLVWSGPAGERVAGLVLVDLLLPLVTVVVHVIHSAAVRGTAGQGDSDCEML